MLSILSLLLGCATEPAAPPPEPEPACDLALDADHLAGKTVARLLDGDKEPDLLARAQFYKEGDVLKVKYNTRALTDMYTYTCGKPEKKEILCLADKPDLYQWCQTLYANKGGCAAGELASLTGASVQEAQVAADKLAADMKKLDANGIARMKQNFSQPNNQLRGVLHVKVNTESCRLTMRDAYQTMERGQLGEYENVVGSARFVPVDKDLVFEHCTDMQNVVALASADEKPTAGTSKVDWKVGETATFAYAGPDTKAEDGCKYSYDWYNQYEPVKKGEAVTPVDGALAYKAEQKLDKRGKQVVHLYRYKDCGKGPELAGVSCQWVNVAE